MKHRSFDSPLKYARPDSQGFRLEEAFDRLAQSAALDLGGADFNEFLNLIAIWEGFYESKIDFPGQYDELKCTFALFYPVRVFGNPMNPWTPLGHEIKVCANWLTHKNLEMSHYEREWYKVAKAYVENKYALFTQSFQVSVAQAIEIYGKDYEIECHFPVFDHPVNLAGLSEEEIDELIDVWGLSIARSAIAYPAVSKDVLALFWDYFPEQARASFGFNIHLSVDIEYCSSTPYIEGFRERYSNGHNSRPFI